MKANHFFYIIMLLIFSNIKVNAQHTKKATIHANSKDIVIVDGKDRSEGNWKLMPELKPDVYKTNVEGKLKKRVVFITDLDSISFDVERNKTYNFKIILNNKDTCWTQINTIPHAVFSKKYIREHKGKYSFEIPEVQELVHILIAITPTGLTDDNMVKHDGDYYKKVINYFEKYKNEPIVARIDSLLQKGRYAGLKMDACGFLFNRDKINKDGVYNQLSWTGDNNAAPFIKDLEIFAKKTKFRNFYKDNLPYYNSLIALMKQQSPIEKQWKWLEKEFNNRYDNYRITFSPLVYGSHSTNKFIQDDFKQNIMFVRGPITDLNESDKIKEGLFTRVVFTEIDHNYVNPVSDKYIDEIKSSLKDIKQWASEQTIEYYGNEYMIFNEYMTWAVFTLYAQENFSKEDFKIINDRVELQMADWRGFKKFKEFNNEVIALYKAEPNIEKIYPKILKWCSEQ